MSNQYNKVISQLNDHVSKLEDYHDGGYTIRSLLNLLMFVNCDEDYGYTPPQDKELDDIRNDFLKWANQLNPKIRNDCEFKKCVDNIKCLKL